MIARRHDQVPAAEDAHELVHVILVGGEYGRAAQPLRHGLAGALVQALHGDNDGKHGVPAAEGLYRARECIEIAAISGIYLWSGGVKVDRAVMTFAVCA